MRTQRPDCGSRWSGMMIMTIYEWRHAIGYGGMGAVCTRRGGGHPCGITSVLRGASSRSRGVIEYNAARLAKDLVARRGRAALAAVVGMPTDSAAAERIASSGRQRFRPKRWNGSGAHRRRHPG